MKRILLAALVFLAGCGVQPTGVTDSGLDAPTGVAPGVTLYFLDHHDVLVPQLRKTGRLGSITEAMALLLTGPSDSGLRTGIAATEVTRVVVDTSAPDLIHLRVPLAGNEVTPPGIDQIVCTALGVHVQGGGSRTTTVQVTLTTVDSGERRTCPLIG